MSIEIKLPELGDGIDSADVLEVFVSQGDNVDKDQSILELETDKATAVVPSTHAGKVIKVHVAEGDTIPVGTLLLTIQATEPETKASPASASPSKSTPEPKPEPPKPVSPVLSPSAMPDSCRARWPMAESL